MQACDVWLALRHCLCSSLWSSPNLLWLLVRRKWRSTTSMAFGCLSSMSEWPSDSCSRRCRAKPSLVGRENCSVGLWLICFVLSHSLSSLLFRSWSFYCQSTFTSSPMLSHQHSRAPRPRSALILLGYGRIAIAEKLLVLAFQT